MSCLAKQRKGFTSPLSESQAMARKGTSKHNPPFEYTKPQSQRHAEVPLLKSRTFVNDPLVLQKPQVRDKGVKSTYILVPRFQRRSYLAESSVLGCYTSERQLGLLPQYLASDAVVLGYGEVARIVEGSTCLIKDRERARRERVLLSSKRK